MNYDESPLGFDCGWCPGLGRVSLSQEHVGSLFREEAKEPKLWFQPEELPALIERLKRIIADDVIPDLRNQSEENQALINHLHEYLPFEPPKKKGPRTAE